MNEELHILYSISPCAPFHPTYVTGLCLIPSLFVVRTKCPFVTCCQCQENADGHKRSNNLVIRLLYFNTLRLGKILLLCHLKYFGLTLCVFATCL
jgi:hypothetical protein